MQPTPSYRRPDDLETKDASPFEPTTGDVRDPLIGNEPLNAGSPLRADEPRGGKRSVGMWVLPLAVLGVLAVLLIMALRPHAVGDGTVGAPGNERAPNVPSESNR